MMVREFTPYSNLWVTTDQWFNNSKNWLSGEWETLDAVAAEKFVEESVRVLAGVIRFFR
jgi:dynein heavy chain